jgi:uncharacterized pyridoxamine 5'-phosphate oxidase family protein
MTELDPDLLRFLRKSMVARIATISPSGRPQLMPLFFFLHGGEILMNNAETSATVRNLRHNPDVEVLFLADRARDDRRCLRVRGKATFVQDPALLRQIGLQAIAKYYASPAAIASTLRHLGRLPAMVRYRGERTSGFIRVTPTSWEFLGVPTGVTDD